MSGEIGYGQQNPNSSSDEFNKIAFLVKQIVQRLDTAKLVKVVGVTGGGIAPAGTVDVLPLVMQVDGAGNGVAHGTVYGLPWSRVQGGDNAVICDPKVDDLGWVVACDRDTSSARQTWKQALPGSLRTFNVADGVYAGGGFNVTPAQYLIFTDDGVRIVDKNGNSITTNADGVSLADQAGNVISTTTGGISLTPASGQPVTVHGSLIVTQNLGIGGSIVDDGGGTYGGNFHTTGTITGDTDVVAAGKSGATHTHTYARPNAGATTPTATGGPN